MTDELNYQEDLAIDPHNLEEECLTHPQLNFKYGEALAHAKQERDKAWEKVKVVKAQLTKDALSDPSLCPGGKATNPAVEAYYRSNPNHQTAKEDLIDAEFKVSMLETAVFSMSARKNQLASLIQLWVGQWFAGPKEPKEIKDGKRYVEMMVAKTEGSQRSGLNKDKSEKPPKDADTAEDKPTRRKRSRSK